MVTIYIRTNLVNGMQYVGQTKDIMQREYSWNSLKILYGSKLLSDDRKKYGFDNFKLDILLECDDVEGDKWEMYYINKYNTLFPNGYNMTSGGIKGGCYCKVTKKKLSDMKKGDKNPFYGKTHSEEQRKKWSQTRKGELLNREDQSKKVCQYTLDGELVATYPSRNEASRQTNIAKQSISRCCNGKQKTSGGYKWKYE